MTYGPSFYRPRWFRVVSLATLSTVLLVGGEAMASDNLAVKTLTEQARFWEGNGRADLSSAAWKRLLQIQPNNPEALAGLAQFELSNNRLDTAGALTDRLKQLPDGNGEALKRIEKAVAQKAINTPLLEQARAAAKAGRADDAVGVYRKVFDGRAISGPVALEYYQTLGGTAQGWDEARRGLEKLRSEEPNNKAVVLAYAQHLTYRASTRREGIRLLAKLSREPLHARSALESWHRALIWLEAGKGDLPLLQAYLLVEPNDAAVRSRVAALNQPLKPTPLDPRSIALNTGFSALNEGDVAAAEKRFETLLAAAPKNPDALGGLGVVRLKQERFADAEKLLSSALRISGNKKWAEALNTATFWLAMEEGQAKFAEGQLDSAIDAYQRAQKIDLKAQLPKVALVRVLTLTEQFDAAQKLLDTMEDGKERREASQQMVKGKASKAIKTKSYAEAERLLSTYGGQLDAEGQELLAWSRYHQGKLVDAAKDFLNVYRLSPSKGAASGIVFSLHNLKNYKELFSLVQHDTGPLRELVPENVRQRFVQGEKRFEIEGSGRLIESDPLIALTEDVLLPAAEAMFTEKNSKKAYDLLLPVENKLVEIGDFSMLAALGLAAVEVGDKATAIRTLRKSAEESGVENYYFAWAIALIRFGQEDEAVSVLTKRMESPDADFGEETLTLLAWTQSGLGRHDQAVNNFALAYAIKPSEATAKAFVQSVVKAKKPNLILDALNKNTDGPLSSLVAPDVRAQIAAGEQNFHVNERGQLVALSGIAHESGSGGLSLKLEARLRSTSGVPGENKLRQRGGVATLAWQGQSNQLSLEVERQHTTDAVDLAIGQRWYAKWGRSLETGIDLQLGIGRTLSGGSVQPATVGEVGLGYSENGGGMGVRLFRRGSQESLLAIAGTPDITTGIRWGRVLESGAMLNAYRQVANWDASGSLVVSRVDGVAVAPNRKVEFYGRALRPLESVNGLSLGPELYISRYSRNLSAFEPGHGGYYSPIRAVTAGLFGKYETSLGDVALTMTGGLGWGYNRSEAAPGNPITGASPGQYVAATGRGLAYHARVDGLQAIGPLWEIGYGFGTQRSLSFSDWRANVYVQRRWSE